MLSRHKVTIKIKEVLLKDKLPTSLIINCVQSLETPRTISILAQEIEGLALAINLKPVGLIDLTIKKINPSSYITSGKIKEILETIQEENIELVIVNVLLSPRQQQVLEKSWGVKVLDRTALILEIFGKRANTKEAKLQTDLAQLAYQKSRLVRSWTHLERQRGGAGFMGGPGERQIESDRRQIAEKIQKIKAKLETVRTRRAQMRSSRKKANLPVIALIGYTNAGKSTLFNLLTKEKRPARNMLFDTLDTTMRVIQLPNGVKVVLSDTVGFIADLPLDLVKAFRATLEEIKEADIIIHVRDFSHIDSLIQKQDVEKILQDLDCKQKIIEVLNKTDLTPAPSITENLVCAISAKNGTGIEMLQKKLQRHIEELQLHQHISVCLKPEQLEAQSFLYKKGQVLCQTDQKHSTKLEVLLSQSCAGLFKKKFPDIELSNILPTQN